MQTLSSGEYEEWDRAQPDELKPQHDEGKYAAQ